MIKFTAESLVNKIIEMNASNVSYTITDYNVLTSEEKRKLFEMFQKKSKEDSKYKFTIIDNLTRKIYRYKGIFKNYKSLAETMEEKINALRIKRAFQYIVKNNNFDIPVSIHFKNEKFYIEGIFDGISKKIIERNTNEVYLEPGNEEKDQENLLKFLKLKENIELSRKKVEQYRETKRDFEITKNLKMQREELKELQKEIENPEKSENTDILKPVIIQNKKQSIENNETKTEKRGFLNFFKKEKQVTESKAEKGAEKEPSLEEIEELNKKMNDETKILTERMSEQNRTME
jgi:hypothetical protein